MIIVIDGNWLFNRAAFTADRPENIAWSLVSMACADAVHCKAKKMLIAFDGPKVFRYKLWPLYKINRKGKKFTKEQIREAMTNRKKALALASTAPQGSREIYEYLPLVQHYLTELGIPWVQYPDLEADDVLASAAHQIDEPLVLDVPDKDVYQVLVKPNVRILSTKHNGSKMVRQYITPKKVREKYGVDPQQMVDYQTLIGDPTDYILPIVGPKTAQKLLQQHKTLAKAIKKEADLQAKIEHLEFNKQLVTLRVDAVIPSDLTIKTGTTAKAPKSYKEFIATLRATSLFG